ncbi:MCE family protein [Acidiferrimicrobium sp. IK]|uniref:MCE family protein n=1 Tax=Acidiferrimicrobium sp. IK TaxID=2871700 RepID=UPI0021CB3F46|nr:MlaD family protein [Acidiferrimicrobium sp. IK]MCU4184605.1 MCE family protein [Acidiferrimicrobium sp. IK]
MNRQTLTRLLGLAVITVVGGSYIAFEAVGVHVLSPPYRVTVHLQAAGGIYPEAAVTYRGADVGRVRALHLHPDGVSVVVAINHGVRIPATATASVKEMTAAAEQYLDLVPPDDKPPYLRNGSVIGVERTTVPVSVGQLLNTVNTLVDGLNAGDLNTVSTALAQGLRGAGPDLRTIISDSHALVQALQDAAPATAQTITAGATVLQTAQATSQDFAAFTTDLDAISRQLVRSNGDLVKLMTNGDAATAELSPLISATAAPTDDLVANAATVTQIAFADNPAVRAMFQVLPVLAQNIAATSANGQIRFQLLFNDRNTVCPYTNQMAEPTALVATADLTRNCATSAPDLLQRGAATAPSPQG